jgi:molybdopterin-binding protein
MNKLPASIVNIESSGFISLVDLDIISPAGESGGRFSCVIIETPETAGYLKIGGRVFILFKETEVSIAKNLSGQISLRNRIPVVIKQIHKGAVLTELKLDYQGIEVGSVITTRSANSLELKTGDAVTGLIKANEVSLMEWVSP